MAKIPIGIAADTRFVWDTTPMNDDNSINDPERYPPTQSDAAEGQSGLPPSCPSAPSPTDPPVCAEKTDRREYTADYKKLILDALDRCSGHEQRKEILRREGISSSHVSIWRRQRDAGIKAGLEPKKRGRKPLTSDPLVATVKKLEREKRALEERLRKAELIIEAQRKLARDLGLTIPDLDAVNSDG
ncbi:MAG: hypothetical protein FWD57_14450 [Polyangiaceae bacterium]|nr:hypothetical protein [Polyangiaceae bacterium]